jgi:hypothetical protein
MNRASLRGIDGDYVFGRFWGNNCPTAGLADADMSHLLVKNGLKQASISTKKGMRIASKKVQNVFAPWFIVRKTHGKLNLEWKIGTKS